MSDVWYIGDYGVVQDPVFSPSYQVVTLHVYKCISTYSLLLFIGV